MIKGELGPVSVPGLFRTIADERRTGLLSVSSVGGHDAFVYFRDGDLYHARIQPGRVQLESRLISAGLVSTEEVEQALLTQKAAKGVRRVGELLVSLGLLQRTRLEPIVREQFEDTVFELLGWHTGTFSFENDEQTDEDDGIETSVDSLVIDGAGRLREWHEISKRVPSFDAVPEFAENKNAPVEVALTPEEWSFVSRLDGRLSVAQLAQACGFSHLEAGRCIFSLVSTGLLTLHQPEGSAVSIDEKDTEEAVKELQDSLERPISPASLEEIVLAGGGTGDVLDESSPEALEEHEPQVEESEPQVEEPEPEPESVELFDSAELEQPIDHSVEVFPERASEQSEVADPPAEEQDLLETVALAEEVVLEDEPEPELEPVEFNEVQEVEPDEIPVATPQFSEPRITMPVFATDATSNPGAIDGDRGIVAEELVEEKDSITKVLAELARPLDEDFQPPPKTNGELRERVAQSHRPKSGVIQPRYSDPRPVDPLVDTTALIRELATYSETRKEPPNEPPTEPPPDETPPRKPGLFGRKKKR